VTEYSKGMKVVWHRAVVVGPNALIREGLTRVLSAGNFFTFASVASIDDLVGELLPREEAFLLIIDVGNDLGSVIEKIAHFKDQNTAVRIVLLAQQQQVNEIVSAFLAGVNAYLVNFPTFEIFIRSIELVMLGATILPPELLTRMTDRQNGNGANGKVGDRKTEFDQHRVSYIDNTGDEHNDIDKSHATKMVRFKGNRIGEAGAGFNPHLSARQKLILRYLLSGDSNKTIARKIAIAEATVKVHVKLILRKIQVRNRTQAAVWAMNHNDLIANDVGENFTGPLRGRCQPAQLSLKLSLEQNRGDKQRRRRTKSRKEERSQL
jgi:two-component system, NarL family, nitrate/nitrite response regulator NarL